MTLVAIDGYEISINNNKMLYSKLNSNSLNQNSNDNKIQSEKLTTNSKFK